MGNVLVGKNTYDDTTLDLGAGGNWRGALVDGRVRRFTGVPYAEPPVGKRRWKRTRGLREGYVYGGGKEAFDATRWGEVCWQVPFAGMMEKLEYGGGGDCLRVNVWMPVGEAPEGGWPVVMWFHGEL